MSFSGLKTAVVNLAHNAQQKGEPLDESALARDFTQAVSDELTERASLALEQTGFLPEQEKMRSLQHRMGRSAG